MQSAHDINSSLLVFSESRGGRVKPGNSGVSEDSWEIRGKNVKQERADEKLLIRN